ncbi:hypothetical protein CL1_1801 [Thermococcus cleftensis]|uniref:MIP18 family-like domain-containing protein n=1 Tax=Thermococcus cleftensis (strain DSM 27260 / KACC 17922 / CL1) TaxID=163003 RepID=I3ZWB3_THECF|nr:hypothetical protein [Thermococcus cleftensis]AFL95997.1 hypothetical protein CL1_1801 [Thermococcus cleftensis]
MKAKALHERLKRVREPITDVDIVSLGLVEAVIADEDGTRIYLRLAEGLHRPFQHALSWPIRRRIVRDIINVLDDVPGLEIIDARTLERYYPLEED